MGRGYANVAASLPLVNGGHGFGFLASDSGKAVFLMFAGLGILRGSTVSGLPLGVPVSIGAARVTVSAVGPVDAVPLAGGQSLGVLLGLGVRCGFLVVGHLLGGHIVLGAGGVLGFRPVGFAGIVCGAGLLIDSGGSVERLISRLILGRDLALNVRLAVLGGLDFIRHRFTVGREPGAGSIPVKGALCVPGLVCAGLGMRETMFFSGCTAHRFLLPCGVVGGETVRFRVLMVQVAGGLHLVAVVCVLALLVGSTVGVGGRVLCGILGPLGGVLGQLVNVGVPDGIIF